MKKENISKKETDRTRYLKTYVCRKHNVKARTKKVANDHLIEKHFHSIFKVNYKELKQEVDLK